MQNDELGALLARINGGLDRLRDHALAREQKKSRKVTAKRRAEIIRQYETIRQTYGSHPAETPVSEI